MARDVKRQTVEAARPVALAVEKKQIIFELGSALAESVINFASAGRCHSTSRIRYSCLTWVCVDSSDSLTVDMN